MNIKEAIEAVKAGASAVDVVDRLVNEVGKVRIGGGVQRTDEEDDIVAGALKDGLKVLGYDISDKKAKEMYVSHEASSKDIHLADKGKPEVFVHGMRRGPFISSWTLAVYFGSNEQKKELEAKFRVAFTKLTQKSGVAYTVGYHV